MQYEILKFMSRLTCLLSHQSLLHLGKWLGLLYFYIAGRQRNRSIAQMQESLHLSRDEAYELTRRSFINIGRNFLEIMYMPRLNKENFRRYIEFENLHYLKSALAEGHGVVVLTAHVGNWEWLSASFCFEELPVTAIVKRQPNEQHTRLLNEFREMVGAEVFSRGTTELVGAAKALKKGKILGFLADQDAGPTGAFVDFLGKPASSPLGPAVFSKRFQSPIIPAFIVRLRDGGHKVIIKEPLYYENRTDTDDELYDLTVTMVKIVEDIILQYPDQWLWFQKRWNTPLSEKREKQAIKGAIS